MDRGRGPFEARAILEEVKGLDLALAVAVGKPVI
jgi:hypothetical protein